MSEDRAHGIAFEIDYWKVLLDDVLAINRNLQAIADHVADTSVAFVTLGIIGGGRGQSQASQGLKAAHLALDEIQVTQAALMRMVETARGRQHVLEAKLDELGA